MHTHTHTEVSN